MAFRVQFREYYDQKQYESTPPLRRQISKHQLMFNLLTPEDLFSECFYQPDDAMSALLKE